MTPVFVVIGATVLIIVLLASLASFGAMAWDKRAARLAQRRIPESTLHFLEAIGGWPGSFAAQRMLRHKTRKVSYQLMYWSIVALWAMGAVAWMRWR